MRKKVIMVTLFVLLCYACFRTDNAYAEQINKDDEMVIGVMSDTHYFSKSLYSESEEFNMAVNSDRKMIREGNAILDSALDIIEEEMPDVVLITGDLTKDGEKISHMELAKKLDETSEIIRKKGKLTKFYVINGNHDINNPHSKDYSSGKVVDAKRTSTEEFRQIYRNMGYGEESELYIDEDNMGGCLSYAVRLREGYTLIAVDTGKYSSDQTASGLDLQETGGVISQKLLNWVSKEAMIAKSRGDKVIVIQHHGVVPHYSGEDIYMPDYLVDNYKEVCQTYANSGVDIVYTGHMHANDISKYTFEGNTFYDIETGSLLTYPSPIRITRMTRSEVSDDITNLDIKTRHVKEIDYIDKETGNKIDNLTEYSKRYIFTEENLKTIVIKKYFKAITENIMKCGGTKRYLARMMRISEEELNGKIVDVIKSYFPTSENKGIKLNIWNYNLVMYYDKEVDSIVITEVTDGKIEPLKLMINMQNIRNKFLDNLFIQIDNLIKSKDEDIEKLLNTIVENLLYYKIDSEHSILELVRQVYITHLYGEEKCPKWVSDNITELKNAECLDNIIKDILQKSNKRIIALLSNININCKDIILKGNDGLKSNIAYGMVTKKINNLGDIISYIKYDYIPFGKMFEKVGKYLYGLAYGLCFDENYIEDNETRIELLGIY